MFKAGLRAGERLGANPCGRPIRDTADPPRSGVDPAQARYRSPTEGRGDFEQAAPGPFSAPQTRIALAFGDRRGQGLFRLPLHLGSFLHPAFGARASGPDMGACYGACDPAPRRMRGLSNAAPGLGVERPKGMFFA